MPKAVTNQLGSNSISFVKPKLSAILLAPDGLSPLQWVLGCLQAQGLGPSLEVVLVVPWSKLAAVELELHTLPTELNIQLFPFASCRPTGPAAAAGMLAARADLVVQCEDHSLPKPGWAEALIQAHQGDWAAVGPAVDNANPGPLSWADYILSFLTWYQPPKGPATTLAGHNTCYKREVIARLTQAGDCLQSEIVFHRKLAQQGYRLLVEPSARVGHYNISKARAFLDHKWLGGRIFASQRSSSWPAWRRFAYAAGSPLVPLLRLKRIVTLLSQRSAPCLPTLTWAWLLFGLVLHAAGEAVGYVLGSLGCETAYAEYELRRFQYLRESDQPGSEDLSSPWSNSTARMNEKSFASPR